MKMKRVPLLLLSLIVLSCGSDDDASVDLNLLYGQWYDVGLCNDLNTLILNSNKDYVSRYSGYLDCDAPEPDIYQVEGTFQVNGNFIKYNQESIDLIIDGTDLSTVEFPNPNVKNEIIELTETSLVVQAYVKRESGVKEILGTRTYER